MIHFTPTPKLMVGMMLLGLSAFVALADPRQGSGKFLQVDGSVQVNGTNVLAGATVLSDSLITTGQNSSAVVSLGKLGRVEVLPQTTMELDFADSGVTVTLDAGRVRLSSSSNVVAIVQTSDGLVITTADQRNEFTVDTSCENTFVSVAKGAVELRTRGEVKQIAAGNQDSVGTPIPGCTPAP